MPQTSCKSIKDREKKRNRDKERKKNKEKEIHCKGKGNAPTKNKKNNKNKEIRCQGKEKKKRTRPRKPCEVGAPFPGADGYWIIRDNFDREKSFGYFECNKCKNMHWKSAHAYRDFKQGCRSCDTETLPGYMWDNMPIFKKKPTKLIGPHDSDRCEACREGVCTFSRL